MDAKQLIEQGLECELELVHWSPGFSSELVARLEGLTERASIGLLFLWSSLAFLEARPLSAEGILPSDYSADDAWGSLDFLDHFRWDGRRLGVELRTLRGRQVDTSLRLDRMGVFSVRTQGRGDSALWWFRSFRS